MKLKNILITAATLCLTVSSIANANTCDHTRFNLGAEASFINHFSNPRAKDSKIGANAFVGAQFNKNFGIELGTGFIPSSTYYSGHSVKVINYYIDALGLMPITNKIDLIGALGLGSAQIKWKHTSPSYTSHSSRNGVRFGLGGQYHFNESLAVRAMLRDQTHIDNISATLGLIYTFK